LKWKTELSGKGCSTPVVAGDRIFITGPAEGNDALLAYDFSGKEQWRLVFGKEIPGRGKRVGSGSNSSPVTDGKYVVGYYKSGRVVGATVEGKKLWEVDLHKKYGDDTLWWDEGTSPVLAGGNVVIAVMQTKGNSYLLSLKLKTGEVVWHTPRVVEEIADESGDSYTTPHVTTIDGVESVVTFGADHLIAHRADNGKEIWRCGGINPEVKKMWRTIASSVLVEDIAVVPHGRGGFLCGIKCGGKGDITKGGLLWRRKCATSDASSPTAKDGKVYVLIDRGKKRGRIVCIDAKTGKEEWESRLPKSPSTYYASPILVKDSLVCVREDGVVITGKIAEGGLVNVKEQALGEGIIASPIFVQGKLIFRGLWCFEK